MIQTCFSEVLCCSIRHLKIADKGASDSKVSDISGINEYIEDDFEGEMAGEHVHPLDQAAMDTEFIP